MHFRKKFWLSQISTVTSVGMMAALAVGSFPSRSHACTGQLAALCNVGSVLNTGANAATNAGNAAIAKGTADQQQGEQTQNMAQIASGAMQIAQGLLGLMAAMAAQDKGSTAGDRGSNLGSSSYNPYQSTIGTSPTPASSNNGGTTGTSATGNSDSSTSTVKLTPEALRTGTLGAALSGIEKNFGIPRDDFVKALQNGVDPKDILANAPKNKQSMDTLRQIEAGLAAQNAAKSAEAIAANGSGASTNLASVGGAGTGGAPTGAAAEEAGKVRMPASTAPEENLDDMDTAAHASLSPEIKAALAAKAAALRAEKERGESLSWSIFQLVHNRYKKLEPMLYGRVERTNIKTPGEISRD